MTPDDDAPAPEYVLAATAWASNAELVADLVRLNYLDLNLLTLDPTYERGVWWNKVRPKTLVTHHRAEDGTDFRDLPYDDRSFPQIAYDPPYVCPGGRDTSTTKEQHDRYGMADPAFRTPAELQTIIDAGLAEMWRLLDRGGRCYAKSQNYIWSGRLWLGAEKTLTHALALGFDVDDRLEHLRPIGRNSQKRQVHARRNLSTMFVLRKPKRSPR